MGNRLVAAINAVRRARKNEGRDAEILAASERRLKESRKSLRDTADKVRPRTPPA